MRHAVRPALAGRGRPFPPASARPTGPEALSPAGLRHQRRDLRHVVEHGLGDLMLAHHHERRAVTLEIVDLLLGMRPRDDRQSRVDGARLLHHLAALEGVGNGHQQAARLAADWRPGSRPGSAALPSIASMPSLRGARPPLLVVLDDEQRHVLLAQGGADIAADPAMADQHHMVLEGGRADRLAHRRHFLRRLGLGRLGERLLAPRRVDIERGEQQRIEQDADDGAGRGSGRGHLPGSSPSCQAAIGKDEGELADLRERGGDHQRGGARMAEQPHHEERRRPTCRPG